MRQYRLLVSELANSPQAFEDLLNTFGREGWKVVCPVLIRNVEHLILEKDDESSSPIGLKMFEKVMEFASKFKKGDGNAEA